MNILSNIKAEAFSLSRVYQWISTTDVGFISACRKFDDSFYDTDMSDEKSYTLSDAENKKRTKQLFEALRKNKKVGVTKIFGSYPEKQPDGTTRRVFEDSFFVYSLEPNFDLKKFLISLGTKFSQDTILYKEKGSKDFTFYVTNTFNGGKIGDVDFTLNAAKYNNLKYLDKDDAGEIVEKIQDMYSRRGGKLDRKTDTLKGGKTIMFYDDNLSESEKQEFYKNK